MSHKRRSLWLLSNLVAMLFVLALGTIPQAARADLTPTSNTITINAGSSGTEAKVIKVPAAPPKADIEIAIDTTGSMGPAIAQAKAQATNLVNSIKGAIPDSQFSVVDFKDDSDGVNEYRVLQNFTPSAALVNAAINTMTAAGGNDLPEAYNLVYKHGYDDAAIGWRTGSRKFLIVIGDAEPHGNLATQGFTGCTDNQTSGTRNGLPFNTTTPQLTALKAAQRTLFMVRAADSASTSLQCYKSLAEGGPVPGFNGSKGVDLGTDLSAQIVALINASVANIADVHLEVQLPNPNASWITFSPANFTNVVPGSTLNDTVNISVPGGTPPGNYDFVINAIADGANIGSQTLRIVVPGSGVVTCDHPTLAQLSDYRPLGDANGNPNGPYPLANLIDNSPPGDGTAQDTFWGWTNYARAVALQVNFGAGSSTPVYKTVSQIKLFSHDPTKAPNNYFQFSQDGTTWYDIPGLNGINTNPAYGLNTYNVSPPITAQYFRIVTDNTTYVNDTGYWSDLKLCTNSVTGAPSGPTPKVAHQLPTVGGSSPQGGPLANLLDGLPWTSWQISNNPASIEATLDLGSTYTVTDLSYFVTNTGGPNSTKVELLSPTSASLATIANGVNTGGYNYGNTFLPAFIAVSGVRYVKFTITNTSNSWNVGGYGDVKVFGYTATVSSISPPSNKVGD